MSFGRRLALLVAGHGVADGPLQPPALSIAKGHRWQALAAHAAVHGVAVALVTRRPLLGLAEAAAHAAIDRAKRRGRLTMAQDQALHILCKVAWSALATHREGPVSPAAPPPRRYDRP